VSGSVQARLHPIRAAPGACCFTGGTCRCGLGACAYEAGCTSWGAAPSANRTRAPQPWVMWPSEITTLRVAPNRSRGARRCTLPDHCDLGSGLVFDAAGRFVSTAWEGSLDGPS